MLAHVVDLYYKGTHLYKKSLSDLAAHFTRDWSRVEGTPTVYTMLNSNEVTLVAKPDAAVLDALTGILAFSPTRNSTQVVDTVYEDYAEEIARARRRSCC
jgi:hypothetical protein